MLVDADQDDVSNDDVDDADDDDDDHMMTARSSPLNIQLFNINLINVAGIFGRIIAISLSWQIYFGYNYLSLFFLCGNISANYQSLG